MPLNFTTHELTPRIKALIGLVVLNRYNTLDFVEGDKIPVTDAASLLTLKQVLEETYLDGITALKEVYLEGDRFTGIFEDKVSEKLTKRNRFTVSEDEVSYKLENPEDVTNFSEELVEFAAKKAKNCVKGQSCGGSCISKDKTCKKVPSAGAKKKVTETKKATKIASTTTSASTAKTGTDTTASKSKAESARKADVSPAAKKPIDKTDKKKTSASNSKPIEKQEDFDLAVNSVIKKLDKEYNGLIPIYRVREELGNSVSRRDFNKFLSDGQEKNTFQLQGNAVEDSSHYKIRNSLQDKLEGIRAFVRPSVPTSELPTSKTIDAKVASSSKFSELHDLSSKYQKGEKLLKQEQVAEELKKLAIDYGKEFPTEEGRGRVVISKDHIQSILGDRINKNSLDDVDKLQIFSGGRIREDSRGQNLVIHLNDNF